MKKQFLPLLAALILAQCVHAQVVLVSSDIAVSTTWTKNNTYRLQTQIYVLPGATLTIDAGTLIASTTGIGGSLAVCRGAQIYVEGTQQEPVIFTSTSDVATWTGGNPKTGSLRVACNEWGNLTLMGAAFISENSVGPVANTAFPSGANYAEMEGLVAGGPTDTRTRYGGGNDYDCSGSLSYVSFRYGGKVIALNNELNGLSLGGIGRNTDIHHVEIMNNIDDGIEIWGGTVNLKYLSIWNIGDDSIDIDQGYRGKMQFGLIVQGHSVTSTTAPSVQGSGFGDNCFETDGAEQSDYQPVTTTVMYNMTVIGQPLDNGGDHAMAFRDNARVQYRNCIFMDIGERVVSFDNVDGDGGAGYGFNGTLSWAATWTTPFNTTSTVNPPPVPAPFYQAQTSGNLIEVTDCVFFNNDHASSYTEANLRGVFAPANNNVLAVSSPIVSIARGPNFTLQTSTMQPVTSLDPRPANDALTSVAAAPNDGFFTPASYRGAFQPNTTGTWLCGWTASQAFGLTPAPVAGPGQPGVQGAALFDVNDSAHNANGCALGTAGDLNGPFFATVTSGATMTLKFNGQSNQSIILLSGSILNPANFDLAFVGIPGGGTIDVGNVFGGDLLALADGNLPDFLNAMFKTGPIGTMEITFPVNLPPATFLNLQGLIFNSVAPVLRMTDAVQIAVN